MSETLGSTSQLQLIIPSALDTDWATSIRDNCFQKIVEHDHTGTSGKGLKLSTSALDNDSITEALIELSNNAYLVSANAAGSGDINLIKANASDYIEFGAQIAALNINNNVNITGRNSADSANINIIKVNASDKLAPGADFANLDLINNTYLQARNAADSAYKEILKVDGSDEIVFNTTIATADFQDDGLTISDNADNTKKIDFDASSITTGTTRTITMLDADITLWDNPMTTSGDVIYGGASGAATRLAAGSNGEVLTLGAGVPSWSPVAVSPTTPLTKTTTYTATASDDLILVDTSGGDWTLTLYAASGNEGRTITIKKVTTDSNILTIDGNASETIDGNSTFLLVSQYKSVKLQCDGSNWHIVSESKGEHSMVRCHTYGGYGSTNTKIPYYTTVVTATGSAITHDATNATNGASFTIEEDGLYHISLTKNSTSASQVGASLNSSELTTNIATITTTADRLFYETVAGNDYGSTGAIGIYLSIGDVIRPHMDAVAASTASRWQFTIAKIGNK